MPAFGLNGDRPPSFPSVGPVLDSEIDAALHLLESMPFEELQRRGWHLQKNHFYVPLNDVPFLREHPELWTRSKVPEGVDWELDEQLQLLERLAAYADELDDVPDTPTKPGQFVWNNDVLPRGDAYAYYGLIRELKPKRVIEIGAGWSSLVLGRAIAANDQPCEVTLIDPEPPWKVLGRLPRGWKMLDSPVQVVDRRLFEKLEPGDVVFYDGSHCMRTGGDVNWVFFDVLPRLAPGVWIHAHDLFWPWDYPPMWVLDEGLSWNEQYLVQAFLMGNTAYRVRLAMSMLAAVRRPDFRALLPEGAVGGSLWIEKRRRFVPVGPVTFEDEGDAAPASDTPAPVASSSTVEEIMMRREDCVTEDTTIAEVTRRLGDDAEALPVIGEDKLLASIGPAAVMKVLAAGKDPAAVTVGEAIREQARPARQLTIAPDRSLEEADAAMILGGAEQLVVVESGRLVGVISRARLETYRYEAPDGLAFPPDDLMSPELADIPRRALAKSFFESGARTAHVVRTVLREYGVPIEHSAAVLEFGCGSGQVIRHFKDLPKTRLHGSDSDAEAIAWCREALPFAEFVLGGGEPGLDYADESFDLVYFASQSPVPEPLRERWIAELRRLVKRGGTLLVILPEAHGYVEMALAAGLEQVAHLSDAAGAGQDVVLMARPV
jgi:CBS domain-containing protein